MRVIGLAVVLAVSLVLAPLAAEAQQAGKVIIIGFLSERSLELPLMNIEGFRRDLADRGWIEGQNLRIEYRSAEGVTGPGTPAALAAKKATGDIPIVFVTGGDPVDFGIIQ